MDSRLILPETNENLVGFLHLCHVTARGQSRLKPPAVIRRVSGLKSKDNFQKFTKGT